MIEYCSVVKIIVCGKSYLFLILLGFMEATSSACRELFDSWKLDDVYLNVM